MPPPRPPTRAGNHHNRRGANDEGTRDGGNQGSTRRADRRGANAPGKAEARRNGPRGPSGDNRRRDGRTADAARGGSTRKVERTSRRYERRAQFRRAARRPRAPVTTIRRSAFVPSFRFYSTMTLTMGPRSADCPQTAAIPKGRRTVKLSAARPSSMPFRGIIAPLSVQDISILSRIERPRHVTGPLILS